MASRSFARRKKNNTNRELYGEEVFHEYTVVAGQPENVSCKQ